MCGRQAPFSDKHAKVEKEDVLLTLMKERLPRSRS
jgi:hypothetical protein